MIFERSILKRVFGIAIPIETEPACGGALCIIAFLPRPPGELDCFGTAGDVALRRRRSGDHVVAP